MLYNMKQKMLKLPGYCQENIFENRGNPSGLLGTPCFGALGYVWLNGVSIAVISLNNNKKGLVEIISRLCLR